jgi:hypothetical protein
MSTRTLTEKPPKKLLVDGGRPLKVAVQADDLVGARRSDPSGCILARAMLRQKGVIDVRIGACIARVEYEKKTVRYALSKNDRALVAGFDGGADAFAAGYVFTLEPPRGQTAHVPPLGSRRGVQPGSNTRSGEQDGVIRRRRKSLRHIDVCPE